MLISLLRLFLTFLLDGSQSAHSGVQGYGSDYQKEDNFGAYQALVEEGITFVDTAEVGMLALALRFRCTRQKRQ